MLKRIAFFFCMATVVLAELKWESTQQDLKVSPLETNATARFAFRNNGTEAIHISNLMADCGCTLAHLQKRHYAPGEGGEIEANFIFGNRVGEQVKKIMVATDEPGGRALELQFRVRIPEILRLTPTFVHWRKNEQKSPKEIKIKVVHDQPVKITKVVSSSERMTAELLTVTNGTDYTIRILPTDTSTPAWSILRIETDTPAQRPRSFTGYAQVRAY